MTAESVGWEQYLINSRRVFSAVKGRSKNNQCMHMIHMIQAHIELILQHPRSFITHIGKCLPSSQVKILIQVLE